MGGCGEYYARDTEDGYKHTAAGHSTNAEQLMGRRKADPGVLTVNRIIESGAKTVVALIYDVTASVDRLPLIFTDKLPMFAGQIGELGYLASPEVSLAAVGDLTDSAPMQVADFAKIRDLDDWIKRLWRENGGGGNGTEAYAFMAYYYAYLCDIPNAMTPFCVFVADEGVERNLYKGDLERLFGGTRKTVSTADVFRDLDRKFKGNVFLIHRHYAHGDEKALRVWHECLGEERIILMGSDRAIVDLLLGLFAIVNGVRTLDEYLDDMVHARAKPQTPERVAEVRRSLEGLAAWAQARPLPEGGDSGNGFPTPDEVGPALDQEIERAFHKFLSDLRALLEKPNTTPVPKSDGWGYCDRLPLPRGVEDDTFWGDHLKEELLKANWRAEIVNGPRPDTRIIRIRRAP